MPTAVADLPPLFLPTTGIQDEATRAALLEIQRYLANTLGIIGQLEEDMIEAGTITRSELDDSQAIERSPFSLVSPSFPLDHTLLFTTRPITITAVRAVLRGTTPSVTYQVRHSTDRSAAGNAVFQSAQVVTSTTTGTDATFGTGDVTVPADSWIWVETTANSGTIDELAINLEFDKD